MKISSTDQDKFLDEMEKIITSKKKVLIRREEGWYTESEMKSDLISGPRTCFALGIPTCISPSPMQFYFDYFKVEAAHRRSEVLLHGSCSE